MAIVSLDHEQYTEVLIIYWLSDSSSEVKESTCRCRRCGFDPRLVRSPGGGNGNPLQYSCLGNPMDKRAWWAAIHGVAKNQARLSN